MVEIFKICRIKCDYCKTSSFDVYTFDDDVQTPSGWANITSGGWGFFDYDKTELVCQDCVQSYLQRDSKARIAIEPFISLKSKW